MNGSKLGDVVVLKGLSKEKEDKTSKEDNYDMEKVLTKAHLSLCCIYSTLNNILQDYEWEHTQE